LIFWLPCRALRCCSSAIASIISIILCCHPLFLLSGAIFAFLKACSPPARRFAEAQVSFLLHAQALLSEIGNYQCIS
jgi:hypothetical protein